MMFVKLRQPFQEELTLHQGLGELLGNFLRGPGFRKWGSDSDAVRGCLG